MSPLARLLASQVKTGQGLQAALHSRRQLLRLWRCRRIRMIAGGMCGAAGAYPSRSPLMPKDFLKNSLWSVSRGYGSLCACNARMLEQRT